MPSDYSTPPAPESDWVKGELPQEKEKRKEKKGGTAKSAATVPAAAEAVPAANGELGLEALVESLLFVADGATPVTGRSRTSATATRATLLMRIGLVVG